jgi:methyl-accepting chemotaxis protein PixJ
MTQRSSSTHSDKLDSSYEDLGAPATDADPQNPTHSRAIKDALASEQERQQNLQPIPLNSTPNQDLGLWTKVILLAIASMLPILAIGTATYNFGVQKLASSTNQSRDANTSDPATNRQTQRLLLTLLTSTGGLALLTGAIVAYLAQRSMRSAVTTALPRVSQAAQSLLSERLKVVTTTVDNLYDKLSEEEIYASIVKDVRQALDLDRVIVYGLNANLKEVVIAESVAPEWTPAIGTYIPDPCFEARYIERYRNGRVKAIDDIDAGGLSPCYLEQLAVLEVKGLVVAPIVSDDDLHGLLIGHQCIAPRVWQEFEVQWFKQIAAQVGFTISNLKLCAKHESLQQQANTQLKWMQLFTETVQSIWELSDPSDIFNTTVRNVRNVLDVDRVIVYGLNGQSQEVVIAESIVPDWPSAIGAHLPDPCFQARYLEKYRKGRVKAIENIYEANLSPCYIEQLAALKVKALLVAPIVKQDQLIGLLIAHQCYGTRAWQEFEVQWFTQISTQVGLALDKAQNLTERSTEQYPVTDWV